MNQPDDNSTPINSNYPKLHNLLGYTDSLVGLSQWPGISYHWTVALSPDCSEEFLLITTISFDPSQYNKSDSNTSYAWKTRAKTGLLIYEKLLAQLTAPNAIVISFKTGLIPEPVAVPTEQIGTLPSPTSTLVGWLVEIRNFLKERANENASFPEPAVKTISLSARSLKAHLNTEQIFVLDFEFIISRTRVLAQSDFAAMPTDLQIATPVTPRMSIKIDGDTLNGTNANEPCLEQFTKDIEETLSETGQFTLTVGTGENRLKADAGGSNSIVWAVRLGENAENAIFFSINEYDKNTGKGTPQIFAPRPVSNKLVSKSGIMIKKYASVDDFDLATNELIGTQQSMSFSDIDLDNWVCQLFMSIDNLIDNLADNLLSPEYLSSILVIDNKPNAHLLLIASFMEDLNAQKKKLADIAKNLISPVYQEQERTFIDSAKEVLSQHLLDKLSNLYSTKAAVSYSAKVKADTSDEIKCLYGNVVFNKSSDENSRIVLTSPKLELKTSDQIPLTFLVKTPELLESGSSGVLTPLALDLRFDGTVIRHQIAEASGIEDYKASTWLSFVLPETAAKLQSGLGEFEVPMSIRAFPATPRMDVQSGVSFTTKKEQSLDNLISWNYSFTYSQDFHYSQDRVYGEIEYNLNQLGFHSSIALEDAFQPLAQFVTSKNRLEELLKETVPGISAITDAKIKVDDAAKVLGAFLKMITDVVNQAGQGWFYGNQLSKALSIDRNLKYEFRIEEGKQQFDHIIEGKPTQIDAWVIKIVSRNDTPPSVLLTGQRPFVDIPGEGIIKHEICDKDINVGTDWSKGIYAYWYLLNGEPLTGEKAQFIKGRTISIPGMNIIECQNAKSTVFLKRNEEPVEGRPSANEFIYQTPGVSFANPLFPIIDLSEPFNIALDKGGVPKPLAVFLSDFFKELFKKSVGQTQTIQMECQYAYSLVENLDLIHLPVLMLPPFSVNLKTDFVVPEGGCQAVIRSGKNSPFVCELSNKILYWFSENKPSRNKGEFNFDLTVMSDLTQQPIPLIRLRRLYLKIEGISDISDI